jgi:hypothetical protein
MYKIIFGDSFFYEWEWENGRDGFQWNDLELVANSE